MLNMFRVALTGLFLVLCGSALAQEDAVEITADRFVVNEGANEATFSGNVVITQPDLIVRANTVIVNYGPGGPSDLQNFEAIGGVRIEQPEQTATGDRGVYDPQTQIMRLRGNVVVVNDTGTVSGPELIVNIATGDAEFPGSSGPGRVTGIFTTQSSGDGG